MIPKSVFDGVENHAFVMIFRTGICPEGYYDSEAAVEAKDGKYIVHEATRGMLEPLYKVYADAETALKEAYYTVYGKKPL